MSNPKSEKPEADPFAPFKQTQKAWLDAWAKTMGEAVAGEEFAKAMGQYLATYLETSAPMRRQIEESMEKYLQQMNMPTRNEVVSLAERLTNIEMRLDDLDAKMDQILDQLDQVKAARPTRRARKT